MMVPLFAFFTPGPMELLVIAGIGVLLFGKRLPEVGRSLGKSIVEFKKGVSGIEDEVNNATSSDSSSTSDDTDDYQETTAPKFEPPTGEPKDETVAS